MGDAHLGMSRVNRDGIKRKLQSGECLKHYYPSM
jgi:hypothetical protein